MFLLKQTPVAWLRRAFAAGQREWGYALALAVVAGALLSWGDTLPFAFRLFAWSAWLVGVAFLLRRPWQQLFGPVLFYDLVRTARRRQYFALRCGYAAVLLVTLLVFYTIWFPHQNWEDLFEDTHLSIHDSAEFANDFVSTFLVVQFAAVLILTPVYSAGAITEEKERRTLEFLLATDLVSREIILSKLAARIGQIGMLLSTGLPILALTQFMGGVDPDLLLAAFLGTGLTMLSVASLSILVAVYNRTAWDAIFRIYLVLLGLFTVTSCSGLPFVSPWSNLGNPVWAWMWVTGNGPVRAVTFGSVYEEAILGFTAAHLLLTAVCVIWAIRRLRPATSPGLWRSPQATERRISVENEKSWGPVLEPSAPPPSRQTPRQRPPVTDDPLTWKEMFEEALHWQSTASARAVFLVAATVMALPCLFAVVVGDKSVENVLEPVAEAMRFVTVVVACFLLLLVALNAAGRFSREFEKQTLDGLLATPVERDAIVWAKWWASICHVRGFWWFGGLFALWGLMSGLMPVFVPLFIGWWLVYAAFVAGLGLLFSLVTRSTLRATLWTPLAALAVGAGGWLLLEIVVQLLRKNHWWPDGIRGLELIQDFGLSPGPALWVLSPTWWDLKSTTDRGASLAALAGMVYYASIAWLLWRVVRDRFRLLSGEKASAKRR